jgi:hypothetical protein
MAFNKRRNMSFLGLNLSSLPPLDLTQCGSSSDQCETEFDESFSSEKLAVILDEIQRDWGAEPFPSLQSLIADYKSRNWRVDLPFNSCSKSMTMSGLERRNPTFDQNRLLVIAKKFYETFGSFLSFDPRAEYGFFEPCPVNEGDMLYIHADLHGDVITLIGILDHLAEIGILNPDYTTKDGKKVCLLGDYTNRGVNDIETLSLVFLWKLLNPGSVFLQRGNHEYSHQQITYSNDFEFFERNRDLFTACFRALPVCSAFQGERGALYAAHAGFAPTVNLGRCYMRKPIPKKPVVAPFILRRGDTIEKQLAMKELLQLPPQFLIGRMTNWARGLILDSEIVRNYEVANGFGAMVRGHDDEFSEITFKGKVRCTTLPVATASGYFLQKGFQEKEQSLLIQVGRTMEDWTKRLDRAEGTGLDFRLKLDSVAKGIFEPYLASCR